MCDEDGGLKIVVRLPNVDGMSALDLCLGLDGLDLNVNDGSAGPLHIAWPRKVSEDEAKAKFSRKTGELRVSVPYAATDCAGGSADAAGSATSEPAPAPAPIGPQPLKKLPPPFSVANPNPALRTAAGPAAAPCA